MGMCGNGVTTGTVFAEWRSNRFQRASNWRTSCVARRVFLHRWLESAFFKPFLLHFDLSGPQQWVSFSEGSVIIALVLESIPEGGILSK